MESREKTRNDLIKLMDQEAVVARDSLLSKERDISVKREVQERTIERTRSRCRDQFEHQRQNYDKFTELSERKQQHHSELVMAKHKTIQKKGKLLTQKLAETIEDHKLNNFERFATKSVNFDRKVQEHEEFLKKEERRH